MDKIIQDIFDTTDLIVEDYLSNNPGYRNMFMYNGKNCERMIWLMNQKHLIEKQDVKFKLEYQQALFEYFEKYVDNPIVFPSLQRMINASYGLAEENNLLSYLEKRFIENLSGTIGKIQDLKSDETHLKLLRIAEAINNMPYSSDKNVYHCLKTIEAITDLFHKSSKCDSRIHNDIISIVEKLGSYFDKELENHYKHSSRFAAYDNKYKESDPYIVNVFRTQNYKYVDTVYTAPH